MLLISTLESPMEKNMEQNMDTGAYKDKYLYRIYALGVWRFTV